MSGMFDERKRTLPKNESVLIDQSGLPYKVRYTTKNTVYFSHKGSENCMSVSQWMDQLEPLEVSL